MKRTQSARQPSTESRVTPLLGLTREQLYQLCEMSGLGRREIGLASGRLEFTYEELHRLCRLVIGPAS